MNKIQKILTVSAISIGLAACASNPEVTNNESSKIKADINLAFNQIHKESNKVFDLSNAHFKMLDDDNVRLRFVDISFNRDNQNNISKVNTVVTQTWKKIDNDWNLVKTKKRVDLNLDEYAMSRRIGREQNNELRRDALQRSKSATINQ